MPCMVAYSAVFSQAVVACMQAEQMMRDFDDIMIPLQLNLTSQGCIDKDVRPLKVPITICLGPQPTGSDGSGSHKC